MLFVNTTLFVCVRSRILFVSNFMVSFWTEFRCSHRHAGCVTMSAIDGIRALAFPFASPNFSLGHAHRTHADIRVGAVQPRRPIASRQVRPTQMTKRWYWISDTSANRDDMHWSRRSRCRRTWGHLLNCWFDMFIIIVVVARAMERRNDTYSQWSGRCTTPSSSATRTAGRFSVAIEPAQGIRRWASWRPEWTPLWCMLGRTAAKGARDIPGWHSIPGEMDSCRIQMIEGARKWLVSNMKYSRCWICCGIHWTCGETDSTDSRIPWSNTPTSPCFWNYWTIPRTTRSNTANRRPSKGKYCRRMRQSIHTPIHLLFDSMRMSWNTIKIHSIWPMKHDRQNTSIDDDPSKRASPSSTQHAIAFIAGVGSLAKQKCVDEVSSVVYTPIRLYFIRPKIIFGKNR